ncbi:enolase-phosphatase E1 [Verticillium dahliae]
MASATATTSAADLAAVKVVLLDIGGFRPSAPFHLPILHTPAIGSPAPSLRRLFPYALQALPATLDKKWDSPDFAPYRNAFPEPAASSRPVFEAHVADLVKRDVKVSYLKALQGYLWLAGYESGEIKAPLFPDVSLSMRAWHDAGIKLIIYSSGSVPAQKLLFGHTNAQPPNLIPIISDWFDTVNAGMKMESSSYTSILSRYPDTQPQEWLFLSDNVDEVTAARAAGMHSLVVVRPGNAPLPECHVGEGQAVRTFEGLAVGGKRNESS